MIKKVSVILLVIALVILVSSVILGGVRAGAVSQTLPPSDEALLSELQSLLGSPNLDAEMRESLEEKMGALQQRIAVQAEASALVAAKQPDQCAWRADLEAQADPPRKTGIVADAPVPFPSATFTGSNQWQMWLNGRWVQVYAGALGSDPTQGVLVVVAENGGGTDWVLAPAGSGLLTLVAEINNRLTVASAGGDTYYFDVSAMAFAESLEQVLPTLIPLPTPSPTPDPCAP